MPVEALIQVALEDDAVPSDLRSIARLHGREEGLEALRQQAGNAVEISVNSEHLGGFTRSAAQG